MSGPHDLGGQDAGPIELAEGSPNHWHKRMEAMRDCLARSRPSVMHVDEMRRGIEELPAGRYAALDPYQRKTVAIRNVLCEKGLLDPTELAAAIDWLRREKVTDLETARSLPEHGPAGHDDHDHHHDHREMESAPGVEEVDEFELLSEAMIQGLVARGLLLPDQLRAGIERAEVAGPALGADVVARAWVDESFKAALLADGKAAMAQLGIEALEAHVVVLENTSVEHHLVVCTLCSCYPRSILGSPPAWYVGRAYRARAVREPRKVLAEFGLVLDEGITLRVHDSTANMRYLVLPMRPAGTEGWLEERLKRLVTRDSMIGVALALAPGERGAPA